MICENVAFSSSIILIFVMSERSFGFAWEGHVGHLGGGGWKMKTLFLIVHWLVGSVSAEHADEGLASCVVRRALWWFLLAET